MLWGQTQPQPGDRQSSRLKETLQGRNVLKTSTHMHMFLFCSACVLKFATRLHVSATVIGTSAWLTLCNTTSILLIKKNNLINKILNDQLSIRRSIMPIPNHNTHLHISVFTPERFKSSVTSTGGVVSFTGLWTIGSGVGRVTLMDTFNWREIKQSVRTH